MWEYKISKSDLGWIIYRVKKVWKLIMLEYINWHLNRTLWREWAKTFYDKESALSALVITKRKRWQTDITSRETEKSGGKKGKQSWSEL